MRWRQLEQKGDAPLARSSHAITAVGGKLFLWGGENKPREPIDEGSKIHVYDLATHTWSRPETSGEVPPPRNAATAAAVGGRIYVFGGRTGIEMGEGSLDDLYCLDTESLEWSKVVPQGGACPPKRSYHASVAVGGKVFVFGGCGTEGRLNDLWEFDTTASTWLQLPSSDAIKGRGGCGFAAVPGALLVIGGFCGNELNDVHRFDIAAGRWDCGPAGGEQGGAATAASHGEGPCACKGTSAALPARSVFALATHACHSCSHGNHVVVFGGEVEPTEEGHAAAGDFSNDVFCFAIDQPVDGWHKLEPAGGAPCPRGWLAATTCPAGIIISGGNSNSNERLGDLWLLDMHD